VPFDAPRCVWLKACCSQLGLLRRQVSIEQASSHPIPTDQGIYGPSGKVDLQACEDEAGNAANVPLLFVCLFVCFFFWEAQT
jgi:hypothetical protein